MTNHEERFGGIRTAHSHGLCLPQCVCYPRCQLPSSVSESPDPSEAPNAPPAAPRPENLSYRAAGGTLASYPPPGTFIANVSGVPWFVIDNHENRTRYMEWSDDV
jgi:hypothetical protein